jgi:arylsulfatase A-like enzyme
MRRFLVFHASVWLPVVAILSLAPRTLASGSSPNILLILMEDMGTEIGPYGDQVATTPALDRLASEGIVFSRGARVTAATCAASRGSLFTGLYPHQNGMFAFDNTTGWHFRPGCPTYVQVLREHGYYAGRTYKTGIAPEKQTPFDFSVTYWENKRLGEDSPHLTTNSIENFEVFLTNRPQERPFYFQAQTPDTHSDWMEAKKRAHIRGVASGIRAVRSADRPRRDRESDRAFSDAIHRSRVEGSPARLAQRGCM